MATVLITGSNRGIGLALSKKFLAENWTVHACCRDPENADELRALAGNNLVIHELDVSDDASINALVEKLQGIPLDMLLNNAGIAASRENDCLGRIDYDEWARVHMVNTMAPVKLLTALLDNLRISEQKLVITISSQLASIANSEGYMTTYSSSKAAMNAAMKSLSGQLAEFGIRTNMLSPGWVQTDMGGAEAPLTTDQSAALLYRNITSLGSKDTGRYLDHEGSPLPW